MGSVAKAISESRWTAPFCFVAATLNKDQNFTLVLFRLRSFFHDDFPHVFERILVSSNQAMCTCRPSHTETPSLRRRFFIVLTPRHHRETDLSHKNSSSFDQQEAKYEAKEAGDRFGNHRGFAEARLACFERTRCVLNHYANDEFSSKKKSLSQNLSQGRQESPSKQFIFDCLRHMLACKIGCGVTVLAAHAVCLEISLFTFARFREDRACWHALNND